MNVMPPPVRAPELSGGVLDRAVADALGLSCQTNSKGELVVVVSSKGAGLGPERLMRFAPSTDWAAFGLALELARPLAIVPARDGYTAWATGEAAKDLRTDGYGKTMLVAAMRCIAALGSAARA